MARNSKKQDTPVNKGKAIIEALNELEREKHIDKEKVMDAIEKAIESACAKEYPKDTAFDVTMNRETGEITAKVQKTVIDDDVIMGKDEILLKDALLINPDAKDKDEIFVEIKTEDFGRIAAVNAKNVIIQEIKECEKQSQLRKFSEKVNDIVTGTVMRIQDKGVRVALDENTEVFLAEHEMLKGERYKVGDRIKVFVVSVKEVPLPDKNKNKKNKNDSDKQQQRKVLRIQVSRTHPGLVKRLFELEIPEIANGVVEIKNISREPGSRSKVAVKSNDPNVDAVGSCVGSNGERSLRISNELSGEKLDIVEYSDDIAVFVRNALSPSGVNSVVMDTEYDEDGNEKTVARVVVPDNQLSLAIGRFGQNAKLAAGLTMCTIDIKSDSQSYIEELLKDFSVLSVSTNIKNLQSGRARRSSFEDMDKTVSIVVDIDDLDAVTDFLNSNAEFAEKYRNDIVNITGEVTDEDEADDADTSDDTSDEAEDIAVDTDDAAPIDVEGSDDEAAEDGSDDDIDDADSDADSDAEDSDDEETESEDSEEADE